LIESAYHAIVIGYKMFVLRVRWTMFPGIQDVQDAIAAVRYNLGLTPKPPEYDRYSFAEKAEYWALIWGTAIMAFTGFMLWNPITTSHYFQGDVIPAAKAAHGAEAILAVLAIVVWHIYHVHIRTFNRSMFIGKLAAHEMQEEHALEVARLQGEKAEWKPTSAQIARWRRVFAPIAAIVAVVLALGIYLFLAAETTAITTLPKRATVQVFAPRTSTPTQAPTRFGTPVPGQTQVAPGATPQVVGALKPLPASHAGRTVCQVCHATGVGGAPKNPPDHTGRLDAACADCHKQK
jgi:cytochrome b subunit of formate dehydrogenase